MRTLKRSVSPLSSARVGRRRRRGTARERRRQMLLQSPLVARPVGDPDRAARAGGDARDERPPAVRGGGRDHPLRRLAARRVATQTPAPATGAPFASRSRSGDRGRPVAAGGQGRAGAVKAGARAVLPAPPTAGTGCRRAPYARRTRGWPRRDGRSRTTHTRTRFGPCRKRGDAVSSSNRASAAAGQGRRRSATPLRSSHSKTRAGSGSPFTSTAMRADAGARVARLTSSA